MNRFLDLPFLDQDKPQSEFYSRNYNVPDSLNKLGIQFSRSNKHVYEEVRPNMRLLAHMLGGERFVRNFKEWQKNKKVSK